MPGSRKSTVRFRERAELLDFLLEVAAATSSTLDLDQLMGNVADIVAQVIPHQMFALLLYSERARGLRIRHSRGHRDEIVKNLVMSLGEGITGAAAAARAPILVGDVHKDPRYLGTIDAVRSELAVPMMARGKLVGVIDVQSTRENAYSEQDRALLMLIASRVGSAIDNARLHRRVERNNRTLRTLAQLAQEFSAILNLDELMKRIERTMRRLISYDAFSLYLLTTGGEVLKHRFSQRYDQRVELDNLPVGVGIVGAAASARQAVRVLDTHADSRYVDAHPGIRSEVAVPLIVKDRVVGVMDLESERLGYFTEDHERLLTLLAPQIAISIENARLYEELAQRERSMEEDLKAARRLQGVMLPRKAPEIPGLEVGLYGRPAREISGDLYDFFEHGDEQLIAFGDSSGKGAAAALYGALVTGFLRTLASRRRQPAILIRTLNDALLERKVDAQYVTLLMLLWQVKTRTLTLANAGAVPPIVCRDRKILHPHATGVPLGLLQNVEYEETTFQAQNGDTILLYSDGVQDQLGEDDGEEEYGKHRLPRLLTSLCHRSAHEIAQAIITDLDAFRGDRPIADDQTLIVMKVS
ncbi:MAG TPA: serine/threonine protein phosphatase [Solibacterales bacterium]|nr:serine/threonine protein phosphatase [Bryobacterales bacterium]